MKIAFRTDASLQIGSGHVMRCLTLADGLKARGAECHFISREHQGNLIEIIRKRGYPVSCLTTATRTQEESSLFLAQPKLLTLEEPVHASWLASTWQVDAEETKNILIKLQPDWLIVDHYGLEQRWEEDLRPYCQQLMVIDDLADRSHHCSLLLDQNLGRRSQDYANLVPRQCQLLIGPQYSLLRPEFMSLRSFSLQRREVQSTIQRLFISLGGVDQPNATGEILKTLRICPLPRDCHITVVMGLTAPWLENVQKIAADMPWITEVIVNVSDMARRMAESDLAIGAAGSTSWERCCLGLPTLTVVLAENQRTAAEALEAAQATRLIGGVNDISKQLPLLLNEMISTDWNSRMSIAAAAICEGKGVEKVLRAIGSLYA